MSTQSKLEKQTIQLTLVNQVEVVDKIIRQLHKIDSKMLSGQFIPAYRDLRSLLSFFEQHKKNILSEQINEDVKPLSLPGDFEHDQ